MAYPRWRFWLLVAVPIWLGIYFGILLAHALGGPVSSLGTFPLPPVVGMTESKPGLIVSGVLSAAEHEAAEGHFSIGRFSVVVPPESAPAAVLRGLVGQPVEVTVQRIEPRAVKRLER